MQKNFAFNFKEFVNSLKINYKYDVVSGFIVSLIALPLCLGVASASNFPPVMGVLTAIIGGAIIGLISGSELAIKGPAAGLIVIVAGAVEEYGRGDLNTGYLLTASLIAVTGVMQFVLGYLKIGKYADFIPSSVIHGMLAAIGIIIISKQIHLLIGISPTELKGLKPLDLIKKVPESLLHLEWHISVIGIISLLILFFVPRIKNPFIKAFPPFLIVIISSIIFAQLLHLSDENYRFYNPLINPGELKLNFAFDPAIFDGNNIVITLKYFFLLTIIGTIESILTVKAVDLLDPLKRNANYNQDVMAVGIGNVIAGLFGALPMISEVARSSANINNKAITRLSAIVHGIFLMIFILIFSSVIQLIPVAALSSILIFVGFKLANPKDFIKSFGISAEHFLVFVTTIIITLMEDLLIGVLAGMLLKIVINYIRSNEFKKLFIAEYKIEHDELSTIVYIKNVGVFTNWLQIKNMLSTIENRRIVLDFSQVKLADSAFIENLYRFKEVYKGEISFRGFSELRPIKSHPYSMRLSTDQEEVIKVLLSHNQKKLKAYCEEAGFLISFTTSVPKNYLYEFKSLRHSDLRLTEVYIKGTVSDARFEYIEAIIYDSVDMIEYKLNGFIIDVEKGWPKFKLMAESKLDTVIEIFIRNQVEFNDYPVFNKKYSVYSRERDKVKNSFTSDLIKFFESCEIGDRVLDSNGSGKVLIASYATDRSIDQLFTDIKIAEVLLNKIQVIND